MLSLKYLMMDIQELLQSEAVDVPKVMVTAYMSDIQNNIILYITVFAFNIVLIVACLLYSTKFCVAVNVCMSQMDELLCQMGQWTRQMDKLQ